MRKTSTNPRPRHWLDVEITQEKAGEMLTRFSKGESTLELDKRGQSFLAELGSNALFLSGDAWKGFLPADAIPKKMGLEILQILSFLERPTRRGDATRGTGAVEGAWIF